MVGAFSQLQLHNAISRKRKRNRRRKQKGINGDLSADKHSNCTRYSIGTTIDTLSDDLLINILSRVGLKEAARASVVARRWKNLWKFAFESLEFDDGRGAATVVMKKKKFKHWVNAVMRFHQLPSIHGLIIRFSKIGRRFCRISASTLRVIDSWIDFAVRKQVQRFGLDFSPGSDYEFPSLDKLFLFHHPHEVNSPFRSLRTLRLVCVGITDEVVQYFLASCPLLEQLSIRDSSATRNLQVVDPANLKVLEISRCFNVQSLEISAASLVSLTYQGDGGRLLLKKLPSLCELTLDDVFCHSLVFEPNENSVPLAKLALTLPRLSRRTIIAPPPGMPLFCCIKRLELQVLSQVGRSLLFFTSFIKASPQLREFRIQMEYLVSCDNWVIQMIPFPEVSAVEAVKFDHKNLKEVEMAGYVGCSSEEEFLLQLFKIAPSLERVSIDTDSYYYDDPALASFLSIRRKLSREIGFMLYGPEIGATTRIESKERAKHLVSTFPLEINFVVV